MSTDGLIHEELSEGIIGCAMTVHNLLKPGLREKAYERALVLELGKAGIKIEQQQQFDVIYDGKVIDTLIPDLIVGNAVIVDTKCVTAFDDAHFAQIIGYLSITKLRLGALDRLQARAPAMEAHCPMTAYILVVLSVFLRAIRGEAFL